MTPTETATATPSPYGITWIPDCTDDDRTNGYLDREVCVPGIISEAAWYTGAPRHSIGIGTYYADGIMERVAENRGFDLDGYEGGVAMMSPADLGKAVWLRRPGHDWQGPFLVVDCSARLDMFVNAGINGIVAEVSWNTWSDWGQSGAINGIEVSIGRPKDGSRPSTFRLYWLQRVTFDNPGGTP